MSSYKIDKANKTAKKRLLVPVSKVSPLDFSVSASAVSFAASVVSCEESAVSVASAVSFASVVLSFVVSVFSFEASVVSLEPVLESEDWVVLDPPLTFLHSDSNIFKTESVTFWE